MKASNSFVPAKKITFSAAITSEGMQGMINKSLGGSNAAARFTSTLISAVSSSDKLRDCDPSSIVAAALRGEGMGLIYGHGYYLVPYGDTAQYQLSYKGMLQLAISTGYYADIDCIDVREGEYRGRDRRTGKPDVRLDTYDTDEERESHPVIGYYAYYLLKDNTFRYEYWSLDRILKHADRYSPAFKLEKYNAMMNGDLEAAEVRKLLNGTPWYDYGAGQERMCKKTVLRQLLNSGYAPLSSEVKSFLGGDVSDGSGEDYAIETPTVMITGQGTEIDDGDSEARQTSHSDAPSVGNDSESKDMGADKTAQNVPESSPAKRDRRRAPDAGDDFQDSFFGG